MLIIKYTQKGEPVPDHECEELILDAVRTPFDVQTHLLVCTDNIIDAARALLAEQRITPSDVSIFIDGVKLDINDWGVVMNGNILPKWKLDWARRTVYAGIERRKVLNKQSTTSDGVDNK